VFFSRYFSFIGAIEGAGWCASSLYIEWDGSRAAVRVRKT
jgi:hypothetical protein